MTPAQHTSRPIVLVPGYWLGAWAWDDVTAHLRATGHETAVLTLPGLDAASTPREGIRFADHVTAVLEALPSSEPRAVLVAHSGAGAVATAVLDAAPDRISRVVYVDSGPATDGAVPLPGLPDDVTELPLPSFEDLAAEGNSLEGLDEGVLAEFRRRAVPHPVGAIREPVVLREPRRHAVPATFVCCSFPSVTVQELVAAGEPMFAAVAELTDLEYVDLPTGHWPMWSRSADLAELIATAARR